MSKEKKNSVLKTAAVATATVTGAYGATCFAIFNRIFHLDDSSCFFREENLFYNDTESNEWFLSSRRHDDFITSFDGLNLHAIRIEENVNSQNWVILCHSYHSCALNMKKLAYEFSKRDYNVLIIDQRGCGLSEGKYTSLGWTEHYDLINWITLLVNMHPDSKIVLYGNSVGANAIMHTCGDFVPKNIICGISDSGFVSQDAVISSFIKKKTNVNGDLFLFGINFFVKQILHFSLTDANAVHQLENAHFPMLFLHEKNSDKIPQREAYNAFYACTSKKDIYFYEKESDYKNHLNDMYLNKMFEFIKTNTN